MSRILFVQGMNTLRHSHDRFEAKYFAALSGLLERMSAAAPLPVRLPARDEMGLLSWTDLVPTEIPPPTKGLIDDFEAGLNATLRRRALKLDLIAEYDPTKTPPTWIGRKLRPGVAQAAMYMSDTPAAHVPYPEVEGTIRSQIRERFRRMLTKKTRIVIGHSLGSVIAYEALSALPHGVSLFLTVGSPIGTPRFIYQRLAGEPPYAWPNVRRWCNVYADRDWFFVPVPTLAGLFDGNVEDVCVHHGQAWNPVETHKLPRYFQHEEVGKLLLDAWRRVLDE